jgi:hypothetical protein
MAGSGCRFKWVMKVQKITGKMRKRKKREKK